VNIFTANQADKEAQQKAGLRNKYFQHENSKTLAAQMIN